MTNQDLYLNPNFKVEGDYFSFEANDDENQLYTVEVNFDSVAAWFGCDVDLIVASSNRYDREAEVMHEACQQIVDRYQTRTTQYDVEISLKKVECYEFRKRVRGIEVLTTLPVTDFVNDQHRDAFIRKNNFKTYKKVLLPLKTSKNER